MITLTIITSWIYVIILLLIFSPVFIISYLMDYPTQKDMDRLNEFIIRGIGLQKIINEAAECEDDNKIHEYFIKTKEFGVDVNSEEKEYMFTKMVVDVKVKNILKQSKPLGDLKTKVLNKTMKRISKNQPTLSGRK